LLGVRPRDRRTTPRHQEIPAAAPGLSPVYLTDPASCIASLWCPSAVR
jgi:hypothetical protein